jgi:hypothetical protein
MVAAGGTCRGIEGVLGAVYLSVAQRVRQLTADNRTLDERLKAARSNLRFQDKRIADLEAQLADPGDP